MAKMGRPRKEINQSEFEKLCSILCTQEEIANFFDCSTDTINRWCQKTYKETFAVAYKKLCVNGKISLRRNAFVLSQKNAAMCIFLLKNLLGFRDVAEIETEHSKEQFESFLNALSVGAKTDWSKGDNDPSNV